jgi:hypothetical protein
MSNALQSTPVEDLAALLGHGAATVHEAAGADTMLPPEIRPIFPGAQVCGPAFPVDCGPGDNLWIHRALYLAPAGAVLVVSCGDAYEFGYWGEILSTAARERQLTGLVIDGGVRDVTALERIGFPGDVHAHLLRSVRALPESSAGAHRAVLRLGARGDHRPRLHLLQLPHAGLRKLLPEPGRHHFPQGCFVGASFMARHEVGMATEHGLEDHFMVGQRLLAPEGDRPTPAGFATKHTP